MSGLLDEVLTAHGGLERWRVVTAMTAHGRFGGLLRSRFPGNRMADVTVRLESAEQRAVFHGFPQQGQQAVFDRGDVRIESRDGIDASKSGSPLDIHTHSQHQTSYVDAAGLVRRHDYVAHPVGPWARAAHYCNNYRRFAGLIVPTQRRVHPRGPGSRPLPHPILVALDIDELAIET